MAHTRLFEAVYHALREYGYDCEILGENALGTKFQDFHYTVIASENDLQFRCSLGNIDEILSDRGFIFANEFNKSMRFSKIYYGEKPGYFMEFDTVIATPEDVKTDAFNRAFMVWKYCISAYKTQLVEFSKASQNNP